MDEANISAQLRAFFKEKGITQDEIASRLGVSQAYINALLTGKKSFGKKQAAKWNEEFGLSASWLVTGDGDMITGSVAQYNQNGDNINGHSVSVKSAEIDKLIELLQKKDEQIDRLLSLLEKFNNKN